ncbi:LysR family transcriptional regulator [Cellulomonas sp. 179-A 4D5 NHS]|uniref:helix-turn-helix domain-containing protein n=1 Tax=Cellulomonas sp. 179-A 4D5 NHS TaxID=3142378 RepID=UPI0039A3BAEE
MEVVEVAVGLSEGEPSVALARRLRSRRAVDRLDYLRTVRALAATMNQAALAAELGVTQPAISAAMKKAREVEDLPEGFSGAGPYEIAERYAAGQIDRARLIEELSRFPYAPTPRTDGVDWLVDDVPKTVGEVLDALRAGLIDAELYEQVQDGIDTYRHTAVRD